MRSLQQLAVVVVLTLAGSAQASGFYMGENGAKASLMGGAFTAQADDLTAIYYNPAGLTQLDGFHFLVDAALFNQNIKFTRIDPGFDPATAKTLARTVTNSGGPFFSPFAGVSYGFKLFDRAFTAALGVYGPPSVGRYEYPTPNYEKGADGKTYLEEPRKFAPQRYSLVKNNILIVYPTLSAAYSIHRTVQVGASLQYVYSSFAFKQSASAAGMFGITPTSQFAESPGLDTIVEVDLQGRPTVTGILGVMVRPLDNLSFGASFRPPVPIIGAGTMKVTIPDPGLAAAAKVSGDQAELALTAPMELRIGASYMPIKGLRVNGEFVYFGWDSVQELLLTPTNISITSMGKETKIAPISIPKKWNAAISVRAGASYDIGKYLTPMIGFSYDQTSSRDEYLAVDFLHMSRVLFSAGLAAHLWKFDVIGGVTFSPTVTKNVTTSEVRAASTEPTVPGGIVGTGQYSSSTFIANLGIRGHFGGSDPKPAPVTTETPPAAP